MDHFVLNQHQAEINAVLLADAVERDRTTARRSALVQILRHESGLRRGQLIVRVEGLLGKGCFGETAFEDTFFRDMQVVRRALQAGGYQLAYRRGSPSGYYLRGQPEISLELAAKLDGSVQELDPLQNKIFKQLSYQQRFQAGFSISNLARQIVANRIHQRNPQISPVEANRLALAK